MIISKHPIDYGRTVCGILSVLCLPLYNYIFNVIEAFSGINVCIIVERLAADCVPEEKALGGEEEESSVCHVLTRGKTYYAVGYGK